MLDLKLADLLDGYGLKGTFYVAKDYLGPHRMTEADIRELSQRHEIGAHTLTHPRLTEVASEAAEHEIAASKAWLEDVTGKAITMFCYPAAAHDEEVVELVKKAGFRGARTTEPMIVDLPRDPYRIPTGIHAYPFPFRKTDGGQFFWRHLLDPVKRQFSSIRRLDLPVSAYLGWTRLARTVFNVARTRGSVFHLWGHSWEIEKYEMWQELDQLLAYISGRNGCGYLTNGDLVNVL